MDRRSIDCYLRFAEVLFRRYKDVVKYWIPFNEINDLTTAVGNWNHGGILNHGTEDFSHQVDDPDKRYAALHNQFVASAKAVLLGRRSTGVPLWHHDLPHHSLSAPPAARRMFC